MKALFVAIRQGDLEGVRVRIDADPTLLSAVAKSPPKKDDGQSPLQVAIKSAHPDIATLLLDRGADVNFQETSAVNSWTAPVLHDAIRAAVFSSRWLLVGGGQPGALRWELASTTERSDASFDLLDRMLSMGADIYGTDSHGNTPLDRLVLDARQVLPKSATPVDLDSRSLNAELVADLRRIFALLRSNGADPAVQVNKLSGRSVRDTYGDELVGEFLASM